MDYIKDKSWMDKSRVDEEYIAGVEAFLNLAFANSNFTNGMMIECPCKNCHGMYLQNCDTAHEHLICDGFMKDYRTFYMHGEPSQRLQEATDGDEDDLMDDMLGLLDDALGTTNMNSIPIDPIDEASGCHDEHAKKFYRLLKDARKELYPGCKKYSKLSFIVKLLHIKCLNGWSNKSFTMLLEILKEVLPHGDSLPKNYYEAKKIIKDLVLPHGDSLAKHQAAHKSQPENEVVEVVSVDDLSFVEVLGPEVKNRMRGMGYGARCNDVFTPVGRHRRQAITSMQIRMDDMERARKDDELRRRELELELREKNIRIQELELENRSFVSKRIRGK